MPTSTTTFTPLTPAILATLQAGQPIFFRGPEGKMSILHSIVIGEDGKRQMTISTVLHADDKTQWEFDPATIKAGDTLKSRRGTLYTVSDTSGEGESIAVAIWFVGDVPEALMEQFSTQPG